MLLYLVVLWIKKTFYSPKFVKFIVEYNALTQNTNHAVHRK